MQRLFGGPGNDLLDGGAGLIGVADDNAEDVITGGPGHDTILAEGGDDVVYAQDGQSDAINCGPGDDVAFVDRKDVNVANCERLEYDDSCTSTQVAAATACIKRSRKTHAAVTAKSVLASKTAPAPVAIIGAP